MGVHRTWHPQRTANNNTFSRTRPGSLFELTDNVLQTTQHILLHAPRYELFEWDTYFGALMLSYDAASLDAGLSSLIQITKSKTLGPKLDGHGFVPGYSKGGRWCVAGWSA